MEKDFGDKLRIPRHWEQMRFTVDDLDNSEEMLQKEVGGKLVP